MPILFAPVVGLALGAALAWVAAPELASSEAPIVSSRPFAVVIAFVVFVWLPVVGYFAAFHGDWSYLYLVSSRRIPSAIDLGILLLACATVMAGFVAPAPSLRKDRFGPALALVVAPSGAVLIAVAFAARRLAVSASFVQYHGDFGIEPIGASVLGKGVLLMGIALALGLAWTVRTLAQMASESRG